MNFERDPAPAPLFYVPGVAVRPAVPLPAAYDPYVAPVAGPMPLPAPAPPVTRESASAEPAEGEEEAPFHFSTAEVFAAHRALTVELIGRRDHEPRRRRWRLAADLR